MAEQQIPRERLAAIIERVLPEYGGDQDDLQEYGDERVAQFGRVAAMACDIARASGTSAESALKRLYVIRSGNGGKNRHGKITPADHVTFRTADNVLSALGLNHLWHTELADLYEAA